MRTRVLGLLSAGGLWLAGACADARPLAPLTFRGASDASAAVALDASIVAVADDETNVLRLYDVNRPGLPVGELDVTAVAAVEREHAELDLEGAARLGDRIYWIGSHGRNKDGKPRPNRACLLATEIRQGLRGPVLVPVGRTYHGLVEALLREPALQRLGLERAVRLPAMLETSARQRARLAPKREGLNIEALAPSLEPGGLYIGFRNPRPVDPHDGRPRALVVPLRNAARVVDEGLRPRFGTPILLDLHGLGIRSLLSLGSGRGYLLVAGDHDGGGRDFVLYGWTGRRGDAARPLRSLGGEESDLRIEAAVVLPGRTRLLLLSDDGTRPVRVGPQTVPNKELPDLARRTFRGMWVDLPKP